MRTNRRRFLAMGGAVAGVALASGRAAMRPNILFIAVDDLRPDLGCYGNEYIITPNIDRLAKSSTVFNRAYCQVAVCNPSRASLMTGLRPDSAKVWDLRVHFRDTVPDVVTLPQHFRNNGYYANAYGKMYHYMYGAMEDPRSWSGEKLPMKGENWTWSKETVKAHKALKKKLRSEGWPDNKVDRIRATATSCEDVPDNARYDGAMTDHALKKLAELKDRSEPFFFGVGFFQPHLPFSAPKKYWDLYDRKKVPLAANPYPIDGAPPMAMNTMYELRDYMDFLGTPEPSEDTLTKEQQRRLKHGYCASVTFVDAQIGRLLDYLDESGLAGNTVVVLWGDHGWKLGEHRSWCKQTAYEVDAHVPLIFHDPKAKAKGQATDALVEFVDVYPTLCELAGIPVPSHLEGKSLAPLMDDPAQRWSDAAFSQFHRQHDGKRYMGHSIRTDRYRYVEWVDMQSLETVAQELYDHKNDPMENTNVAKLPENKELLESLSSRLRQTCPKLPPGTCARGHHSEKSKKDTKLVVENKLAESVNLYWIDPVGHRNEQGLLEPGEKKTINTKTKHVFVAVSQSGKFQKFLHVDELRGKTAVLK
ncbi:MAG: sulfatase-like hydrolase/transferase [Kiritimatiellales bacterium]|nr:sulfatase-like hydrolase/transferase [Kiritimatiellales bacterium]